MLIKKKKKNDKNYDNSRKIRKKPLSFYFWILKPLVLKSIRTLLWLTSRVILAESSATHS